MALQFACIMELPGRKKKKDEAKSTIILEAVTRREQSLALFHLLGKVMYNKRMLFNHSIILRFWMNKRAAELLTINPDRQRRSPESICYCQGFTERTSD